MRIGSVSLLVGWLVPLLAALGGLCLALALGWRTRRWRLSLLVLATGAVGLFWALDAIVGGRWILQPAPPLYVCALAAVPVFVVAGIPLGWHGASRHQRLLLLPAVVLCTVAAAGFINQYYAYFPTVGSILRQRPSNEISLAEVRSYGDLSRSSGLDSRRYPDQVVRRNDRGHIVRATAKMSTKPPSIRLTRPAPDTTAPPPSGRLVHITIPGIQSGFRARRAWVYLPPVWFSRVRPQLPVVLLLNGTPGSPGDWVRSVQIQTVANAYAAAHGGRSPILVAADDNGSFTADTECVDRRGSMVDTYLAVDVRRYVIHTFATAADARHWAVEGFSEGGTCAITLALRHPDLFHTFVDVSGESAPSIGSESKTLHDLFGGSAAAEQSYDPVALLRDGRAQGMGAWFAVGASDRAYVHVNQVLAQMAADDGAAVHVELLAGAHTFTVFRAGFDDSFAWLSTRLAAP